MEKILTRERKIQLLREYEKGNITPEDLSKEVFIVTDFLSYMKSVSIYEGSGGTVKIIFKGPFLDYLENIKKRTNETELFT